MDLTDPQQMHAYTYGNANPATWSDPDGLLPGSLDAHDTAVHLRWLDLVDKYGPAARITISPRTQSGADIVCWNCSELATDGAVDDVWVWEVKSEGQKVREGRKSLRDGML